MLQVEMQTIIEMNENISFQVRDGENGRKYLFLLSKEAIDDAVGYRGEPGEKIDRYSIFLQRLEDVLNAAEKLIAAGVTVEPLVITTQLFNR